MKITFLGTSAGTPTAERNVSSIVLDTGGNQRTIWLFDCGEATQIQLRKAKIKLTHLTMIFLTHLHGDHLFGLPGVLRARAFIDSNSPLTLIAPKGVKKFIDILIEISDLSIGYPLTIIELEEDGKIFDDEHFLVEAKLLKHRVPCFGYRIVEKEGKKIAILGDTTPCHAAVELAKDVDLLVHEATLAKDLKEKAVMRGHSTTEQAATIAKEANAKQLIITHISPRYGLKDNQKLLNECQSIFPNCNMATDFATFNV